MVRVNQLFRPILACVFVFSFGLSGFSQSTTGAKANVADSAATDSPKSFLLRHKLAPGQLIRSEATHLAKTNTRINGYGQATSARTVSQKIWEVTDVNANGDMTFVYRIESVDMSKQVGDGAELRYDSVKDTEVPADWKSFSEKLNKPITTVTIDAKGKVVERDDDKSVPNQGFGEIALRLPDEAIPIGHEWVIPRELQISRPDGTNKVIKIRETYKLEKVSVGVATISVRSEPLTIVSDPEIEAKLVQDLSNGTIRFDIDAGRLISKELKWDESVVGFSGAGSMIEYNARYTEEVKTVRDVKTAARPSTSNPKR